MKVLYVLSSLDAGGGVQQLMFNYLSHMNTQRNQYDFITHSSTVGSLEHRFSSMGCHIYRVTPKSESFLRNFTQCYKVMKKNQYDVVHVHQGEKSFITLLVAKLCRVKIRIAHAHQYNRPESKFTHIKHQLFARLSVSLATNLFACTRNAGIWTWGRKAGSDCYVMMNAIDLTRFHYQPKVRERIREELGLCNDFVIGSVGRLCYQKNHYRLLKVFSEVLKVIPNSKLLIIGKGELEEDIHRLIDEYKINDKVIMLGFRSNIEDYEQAMDAFVLTSRFEGLGIVLIESQSTGLQTYAINGCVPNEADISRNFHYLDESNSEAEWAHIIALNNSVQERKDCISDAQDAGYDINREARKLEAMYDDLYAKENAV